MNACWIDSCADGLIDWVTRGYPNEACALVTETPSGWRIVRSVNLADHYHAIDPVRFPNSGRTAYVVDPSAMVEACSTGRLVAIVHSHSDAGDHFSSEDRQHALLGSEEVDPTPLYRDVDYLVISVLGGEARSMSLYRFEDGDYTRIDRWKVTASKIVHLPNRHTTGFV